MSSERPDAARGVVRVVVVDDHAAVRQGLVALLDGDPQVTVVGQAADGEAALIVAAQAQPDVVLMDLQMPRMDGVTATRELRSDGSAIQVLVLTACRDRARIAAAVDAGAVGFLLKDATMEELVDGVRAAGRGQGPRGRADTGAGSDRG
jgi:DNA-binding NarL/FixJ family response regulator